ncbi:MAG TPA: MFS transporter [Spirochaetia bacterium]
MPRSKFLSPSQSRRALNLNIILGSAGTLFTTVIAPGTIMNVFFKNQLGASSAMLGLLVALVQLASILNIVSIAIFGRLPRVKPFWIVVTTVHRMLGFVPAAVALSVARGGSKITGAQLVLLALAVSFLFANLGTTGWWRWMADLVPEDVRATFFGRRSAALNAVTMVFFLVATIALDLCRETGIFWAYFAIFAVGGAGGVIEAVMYVFIPEPVPLAPRSRFQWIEVLEPLKDGNFLRFSFSIGLWLFSTNILSPFIAPYITADGGIDAPLIWLGIMMVITQASYVATATPWGMMMDRMGRKPVVLLGSLYPLSWALYLFITPQNYTWILPVTALVQGLLSFPILDGAGQLMLTLTPQKSRTSYVAWYVAIAGIGPALGALLGGALEDALSGLHVVVAGRLPVGGFQVIALLSFVLCVLSFFILSRIREGKEKPVGFVLSILMTPQIFRTFVTINILGRGEASTKVARALRTVEKGSGVLAVSDITRRLDDPDDEVREEAARALGRIGAVEAVEPLIRHLRDTHSTIRTYAARALGRIGDPRAVQPLIECLGNAPEDLVEASCQALGRLGAREALKPILRLLGEQQPQRVIVAAAEAMSRLGSFETALEILPLMHTTTNPALQKQFATAMGNLLGAPGQFYEVVTGSAAERSMALEKLQTDAQRTILALAEHAPSADRAPVLAAAREMKEAVERSDLAGLVVALHACLLGLCRLLSGREVTEEEALGFAFMHNAKLGLGLWFVTEVKTRLKGLAGSELLEIDALLGEYFLATYSDTQDEDG